MRSGILYGLKVSPYGLFIIPKGKIQIIQWRTQRDTTIGFSKPLSPMRCRARTNPKQETSILKKGREEGPVFFKSMNVTKDKCYGTV